MARGMGRGIDLFLATAMHSADFQNFDTNSLNPGLGRRLMRLGMEDWLRKRDGSSAHWLPGRSCRSLRLFSRHYFRLMNCGVGDVDPERYGMGLELRALLNVPHYCIVF